jgi:UDP-N-acetylglucosamine pyrophosphorylase
VRAPNGLTRCISSWVIVDAALVLQEDSMKTDTNGKLLYGAGNICNHFYTVDFLERVTDDALIFHVARKKIKSPTDDGQSAVTPTENTGIKLECTKGRTLFPAISSTLTHLGYPSFQVLFLIALACPRIWPCSRGPVTRSSPL